MFGGGNGVGVPGGIGHGNGDAQDKVNELSFTNFLEFNFGGDDGQRYKEKVS